MFSIDSKFLILRSMNQGGLDQDRRLMLQRSWAQFQKILCSKASLNQGIEIICSLFREIKQFFFFCFRLKIAKYEKTAKQARQEKTQQVTITRKNSSSNSDPESRYLIFIYLHSFIQNLKKKNQWSKISYPNLTFNFKARKSQIRFYRGIEPNALRTGSSTTRCGCQNVQST